LEFHSLRLRRISPNPSGKTLSSRTTWTFSLMGILMTLMTILMISLRGLSKITLGEGGDRVGSDIERRL